MGGLYSLYQSVMAINEPIYEPIGTTKNGLYFVIVK